jgi:hypothetical protein
MNRQLTFAGIRRFKWLDIPDYTSAKPKKQYIAEAEEKA